MVMLMLSVADRLIGGDLEGGEYRSSEMLCDVDEMVDERLGREGIVERGGDGMNPEDRLEGGTTGRSPPFSTQAQASLKFLVNIVGSDLFLASSFT